MKKCNIVYIGVTRFALTVYICGQVIAYLVYNTFGILTFSYAFSEVFERMLIIKFL